MEKKTSILELSTDKHPTEGQIKKDFLLFYIFRKNICKWKVAISVLGLVKVYLQISWFCASLKLKPVKVLDIKPSKKNSRETTYREEKTPGILFL